MSGHDVIDLDALASRTMKYTCINVAHLEPVTNAENSRRGAKTKLTPTAVREIRAAQGKESCRSLGQRFGVSGSTVVNIWAGRRWAA